MTEPAPVAVPIVLPPAPEVATTPTPPPKPPEPPPDPATLSRPLKNAALRDPMPGGSIGGWGGDTGLDIAGDHLPLYAIADGTLDYAEWGHTRWTTGKDTAFSVRLKLDTPLTWGTQKITHVYYTHMSSVTFPQAEGAAERKHVVAGEQIGVSGIGNGTPHLHLGLLLDDQVEQDSWDFILREHEVRKVLGGYKNGDRLPFADRPSPNPGAGVREVAAKGGGTRRVGQAAE